MRRFAKEVSLVGRQKIDHQLQFVRLPGTSDQVVVIKKAVQPVVTQTTREATGEQGLLAVG